MSVTAIVARLSALPLRSFDDLAIQSLRLPPTEHGFYAWWQTPGAVPGITATPHPEADVELLYVGIAPGKAGSASHLRKRLAKHHRGAIGSSTVRFSLTALLWEREGWQTSMASRPVLSKPDDDALQRWQRRHLSVQWVSVELPWLIEPAVIAAMRPPLNRDHNEKHPCYSTVGAARAALRIEAARRPVPIQRPS